MATITNLQGSTQIWNSDEIINANFQSINNAIVEKTGDQSIAGTKTFTALEIIHDVTSNTNNPDMRRAAKSVRVKNEWNAWWVNFVTIADADNSLIWNRKYSVLWYLKKWATWVFLSWIELFSIEYDTYDGDETYTTKTTINTTSLWWGSQNWTSAWTSYTPNVTWDSWTAWSYLTQFWKYKLIGKMCFINVSILVAKWTLSWWVKVSLPFAWSNSNDEVPLSWRCSDQFDGPSTTKWSPYITNNDYMTFISQYRAWPLWFWALWSNIVIQANWCYEIA